MTGRSISGRRALIALALCMVPGACDRQAAEEAVRTPAPVQTLAAPSDADGGDLDLHLNWQAARVRQVLPSADDRWRFRQHSDLVVRDGEAHRALLLLPSNDGAASRASFRVTLPAGSDCELVTWVALEASVGASSDGVDFGVGVADASANPDVAPITFARLSGENSAAGWREVRMDLADHRGQTVWVILAAREQSNRTGDWLLFGDPRVRAKELRGEVVVDLAQSDPAARRARGTPWSETNVFKPYALFRDGRVSPGPGQWMARAFPWLDSLRLFSALGANWGPTLAQDEAAQIGKNPTMDNRWETNLAREYEFFHDDSGANGAALAGGFDFAAFDRLLSTLGDSGLALHLNLAGAPEAFTGHRGYYDTYHFNELPIVDEAGWRRYVDTLFAHLASRPWYARAQISFFNEPNCRWIDADGAVRKFGYQGDPETYARQYLWTWQAMKPYVRPGQVHLGPFVAEPDRSNPVTDNLGDFLHALHRAFDAANEPLPPWSAFAFNVYDTPQLTLDGLAATKIAYVRKILADEFPDLHLPLRFDEVGVHPIITAAFEAAGAGILDATRWASAWHAEMLALLVDQNVQRASPWSSVFSRRSFAPYFFASVVAGAIDYRVTPEGEIALTRAAEADAPASLYVRQASRHGDRIGALWSGSPDGQRWRVALWHFPRFATSDARLEAETDTHRVVLRLPPLPARRWHVRITAQVDERFSVVGEGAEAEGVTLGAARLIHEVIGVPPLQTRELDAVDRIELDIASGDVLLVEAEARDSVASGAQPPSGGAQLEVEAQRPGCQNDCRERHQHDPSCGPTKKGSSARLAAQMMHQRTETAHVQREVVEIVVEDQDTARLEQHGEDAEEIASAERPIRRSHVEVAMPKSTGTESESQDDVQHPRGPARCRNDPGPDTGHEHVPRRPSPARGQIRSHSPCVRNPRPARSVSWGVEVRRGRPDPHESRDHGDPHDPTLRRGRGGTLAIDRACGGQRIHSFLVCQTGSRSVPIGDDVSSTFSGGQSYKIRSDRASHGERHARARP
jgi:hypothetical protein